MKPKLIVFFAYFLLIYCTISRAQCMSGDCKSGKGKMDYGYAVYEGNFRNALPEGQGTMDYGGGDKYSGEWHEGKENGQGILYKKGVASNVSFLDGVLQLAPKESFVAGGNTDKSKPEGCTTGDCINGYGEIIFASGNSYKGQFHDGLKSGPGELHFADGNILKATFLNNDPVSGSFWYADVKTTFTGSFNTDGTPKDGRYTSNNLDGIVEITNGKITAERHPVRDSLNAIAAKHAREFGSCPYCEGKGEYLNTTYTTMSSTRTEGTTWTPTGGNQSVVTYKTTGGFSQGIVKCPKCKGTGEIKRK